MIRMLTVLAALLLPALALADEATLSYQGTLTDLDDQPITGNRAMTFRLYESADGDDAIWTEAQPVNVIQGRFAAVLGDDAALPEVDADTRLYLGVQIGDDAEFTPRMRIGASLRARFANQAGDVADRDIHPATVSIGEMLVIDEDGNWVGPNAVGEDGAQGPQGEPGQPGAVGPMGPQGEVGPQGEAGRPGMDGAAGGVGPMGPAGARGQQGEAGPQGPAGLLTADRYQRIENPVLVVPHNNRFEWRHLCPAGWQVIGGGFVATPDENRRWDFAVTHSASWVSGNRSGWEVKGANRTESEATIRSVMQCVRL